MESPTSAPLPPQEQIRTCHAWWNTLSEPWKQAFNEVILRRSSTDMPDDAGLNQIYHLETIRLAGPTAPYPNMTFELEDLSGLAGMPNAVIVIVIFHAIADIRILSGLKQIRSLFLHNNRLTSLEGIQGIKHLEEFYFNVNQVESLIPLAGLTYLHTLYCNYNALSNLEGIGLQHRDTLRQFVCLPNANLPGHEIIRMERDIGIRCLKG